MEKETRNAIERATQRGRRLLEEDFSLQLEGTFDVLRDGKVAKAAGPHLTRRQASQREKIVAAIEHKRGAGMSPAAAVADYLRDAAFTTLNRFVALKMLEARELVQPCITKGEQSTGYRELCGMAQGVGLLPDGAGYRLYIESLFDELSTEIKVLFDRRDPASVLWPKRPTFDALLETLNGAELAGVWGEDETIGWVYQYFNSGDERRKMRDESQAPRNSRELAVRNQFFTPRYVVEFLVDNTLGRTWLEMCEGETRLRDRCQYLVRWSQEIFFRDLEGVRSRGGWLAKAIQGDFLAIPEDFVAHVWNEIEHDLGYKPMTGSLSDQERNFLVMLGQSVRIADGTIVSLFAETERRQKEQGGAFTDVYDFVARLRGWFPGSDFGRHAGGLFETLQRMRLVTPDAIRRLLEKQEPMTEAGQAAIEALSAKLAAAGENRFAFDPSSSDLLLALLLPKIGSYLARAPQGDPGTEGAVRVRWFAERFQEIAAAERKT